MRQWGGGAPRAKKSSIHVKSPIRSRPDLFSLCFLKHFRTHGLSLPGPPPARTCTGHLLKVPVLSRVPHVLSQYVRAARMLSNFQISQCTGTELNRAVSGNSVRQTSVTYVIKDVVPVRPEGAGVFRAKKKIDPCEESMGGMHCFPQDFQGFPNPDV